jgi:phenylacetate-coenzyme A ligase PaaK-like adenylate-forming protein
LKCFFLPEGGIAKIIAKGPKHESDHTPAYTVAFKADEKERTLVPGQLIRYQEEKLQQVRSYAYSNSPFYQSFHQGLFDAPLAQLPVLTKTMLMQHFDQVTDIVPAIKIAG